MASTIGEGPRGRRLFGAALGSRTAATMLAFGFSSGLPYALLIGTLNAWLGDVGVNNATIGVLSWIGLGYAFKFLWSPAVDRGRLPLLGRAGRRKSWILFCQGVIAVAYAGLALTDPARSIGAFALLAVAAALGSATQDVAIDAWRIDVADERTPVELLSAVYQLGYRTASIVGGAFALFLAARLPWPAVYLLMAGLTVLLIGVTIAAPDPAPLPAAARVSAETAAVPARARGIALGIVGIAWAGSVVALGTFMVAMLAPLGPGETRPSAGDFLAIAGPAIVAATVLLPLAVAAILNRLAAAAPQGGLRRSRSATDHLYAALIGPLQELTARLGWGVLVVIGFILTYTLCYNMWAAFAYPFYLDQLHYTKDEVAFASKVFGILLTIAGVSLGGWLFGRIGRFPTIMLGAVLPAFGNLVYADLADGGPAIDRVAHWLRLDVLAASFGSDERMVRLLLAIAGENISTGLAGAAFVAYVSSIVSKRFAAVQYALLSSLTFLIGSMARGVAGEAFDRLGYAPVFRATAALGLVAVLFVALEWWRATRVAARREPGDTGMPA